MVLLGGITDRASMDLAMTEGFEFVAMGRALLREPDLVNRIAADASDALAVHPLQPLHADQLRRDALPGDHDHSSRTATLGDARRATPEPWSVYASRVPDMDYEFDRGIAVAPHGTVGEYAAELDAGWVVGGGLNGGYLLAVIGNAIRAELAELGQPDPVSVSAYYLAPSVPGPAVVRVRRVRTGGRRSTVAASLVQERGRRRGRADHRPGCLRRPRPRCRSEVQREIPPPDLPPLEDCVPALVAPEDFLKIAPLLQRFGTRLDPACVGWAVGEPSRKRASSRAGSSWPTTDLSTRWRCCSWSTRCRP